MRFATLSVQAHLSFGSNNDRAACLSYIVCVLLREDQRVVVLFNLAG